MMMLIKYFLAWKSDKNRCNKITDQFCPGDDAFSIDQTVQSNKLHYVYYRRRHIGF